MAQSRLFALAASVALVSGCLENVTSDDKGTGLDAGAGEGGAASGADAAGQGTTGGSGGTPSAGGSGGQPPPPMGGDQPPPPMGGDQPPPPPMGGAEPPPPMGGAEPPPPMGGAEPPPVLDCNNPGEVTTPTPVAAMNPTSDFNVTLNACTRTALALECELGVGHQFDVVVQNGFRTLTANGIPNHDVGDFPNPGNPNVISPQAYTYRVPVVPGGAGAEARIFGIALSGVVLDPGTAETWNDDTHWRYEALRYATGPAYFEGAGATDRTRHPTALGLDCNFAHVQPTGAYHYHGIPTGLMPDDPALTFVGWAGDGYPIFGRWDYTVANDPMSGLSEMRSSYRLRAGARPAESPGGNYDGTFVQDWEYVAGAGDLDECNGRVGTVTFDGQTANTYHYVLTNTFPYIPRCFHAAPDASFGGGGMMGGMGPVACNVAADCNGACPAGSAGCTCGPSPMGNICVPTCMANADCPLSPQGMPMSCRQGICRP